MKPRIFQINPFELWKANTLEEAVRASMELSGFSRSDTLDEEGAKEISLKEASHKPIGLPSGDTETLLSLYNAEGTVPRLLHTYE